MVHDPGVLEVADQVADQVVGPVVGLVALVASLGRSEEGAYRLAFGH